MGGLKTANGTREEPKGMGVGLGIGSRCERGGGWRSVPEACQCVEIDDREYWEQLHDGWAWEELGPV